MVVHQLCYNLRILSRNVFVAIYALCVEKKLLKIFYVDKMTNMRSEYVEFALAVTLEFWNVGSIQMYPSEVVKSL